MWTTGWNRWGQTGDGTTNERLSFLKPKGVSDVKIAEAGWGHNLIVKTDNTVWAWGRNDLGPLGDGTKTTRLSAVKLSGLSGQ